MTYDYTTGSFTTPTTNMSQLKKSIVQEYNDNNTFYFNVPTRNFYYDYAIAKLNHVDSQLTKNDIIKLLGERPSLNTTHYKAGDVQPFSMYDYDSEEDIGNGHVYQAKRQIARDYFNAINENDPEKIHVYRDYYDDAFKAIQRMDRTVYVSDIIKLIGKRP